MKTITPLVVLALALGLSACAMDNYDEPESTLEGRVVYNNEPISVRDNAVQLELWQDGYALKDRYIPVFVRQDGTFKAVLFDGEYKLVRKRNNGPWVSTTDTIRVTVDGSQTVDVPVQPFFTISAPTFTKNGANLTGTATITKVATTGAVETVALFIGKNQFVDSRYNNGRADMAGTNVTSGGQVSMNVALGNLANEDYVFARIGVKTVGVEEMIYSQVQKVQLK